MADVDELARTVTDLQRRIAAMERSAQLPYSSVDDGAGGTVNARTGILAAVGAAASAAEALAAVTDLQATADGKVTVFYRDDAPTEEADNPEYGDQWLITSTSTTYQGTTYLQGTLMRYDGDTWLLSQDSGTAAAALSAAQNAQDTADGKIVTYWQPTDPSPGITPSSGDLWYQTNTANAIVAVWRWDSGLAAWRNLPLTSGAIALGGLGPDRLNVGVVTNLAQDPLFTTSLRTPPNGDWSILGPDTTYTDSNYLRAQDRTAGQVGTGAADTTWRLTDRIPVDEGRTVRVAALVRCDAASVAGSGAPTQARLRVWFYSSDPNVAALSGTDQLGVMVLADAMAGTYGQWVPLEKTFLVPDGYSQVQCGVQVTNQILGSVDFIRPEVQVLWSQVQSADYVQGETGWAWGSDTSQAAGLNVLGQVGADQVATNGLTIGGADLWDLLYDRPRGVQAVAAVSGVDTASVSAETILLEFNGGALQTGRLYRLHCHGRLGATVAGDSFNFSLRYTTDGTTVTSSSGILDGSLTRVGIPASGLSSNFDVFAYYGPAADYPVSRFGLSIGRASGTGLAFLDLDDVNRRVEFALEDVGPNRGAAPYAQRSKVTGTPDSLSPAGDYVRTFDATWSRSYDSDLATREGDDGHDLHHGYADSTHGNTRALIGFDYAAIQAALSGATIKSCVFRYRVKHSASSTSGSQLYVATHNYVSKPTSWAAASVVTNRVNYAGQKEGVTYTHDLGVTIGNEFKSGSTRGLGFGPAPSNSTPLYYAYMYGFGTPVPANAPALTFTYSK